LTKKSRSLYNNCFEAPCFSWDEDGLPFQLSGKGGDKMGKSELRDGMRIDWDVPITLDDGVVLRADIYRPSQEGSIQ